MPKASVSNETLSLFYAPVLGALLVILSSPEYKCEKYHCDKTCDCDRGLDTLGIVSD